MFIYEHLIKPNSPFSTLVDHISSLVRDVEVFKLMNLIILFSSSPGVDNPSPTLSAHFDKYVRMLRRKLDSSVGHGQGKADAFLHDVFNHGYESIDELAGILKIIRNA